MRRQVCWIHTRVRFGCDLCDIAWHVQVLLHGGGHFIRTAFGFIALEAAEVVA